MAIDFLKLREGQVDTFSGLAILISAEIPLTMKQLSEISGVTARGIERFIDRDPSLLTRVRYKGERPSHGKAPTFQYIRSAKANKLLKKSGIIA
jgi:hypothetical protein